MKTLLSFLVVACLASTLCLAEESYEETMPYKLMGIEFNTAGFLKETPPDSKDPLTMSIKVNIPLDNIHGSWNFKAELTGANSTGGYLTVGPTYKKLVGKDFAYKLNIGAGMLISHKQSFCVDAGALLVQKTGEVTYLLAEAQTKSNGKEFWYMARVNWQILGAIGIGVRAQKNSLLGPCFQLGHENFSFMWFGAGVKEDVPSKLCIAGGVKIVI